MATIRIYKVAEVLGLPSHEVIDLLKREHGIEVRSASSTIEEIVARQFAERIARDRDLNLPTGRLFSKAAPSPPKGRTSGKSAKTSAPPMRPRLGPPRLVKAPKVTPVAEPGDMVDPETTAVDESVPEATEPITEPISQDTDHGPKPTIVIEEARSVTPVAPKAPTDAEGETEPASPPASPETIAPALSVRTEETQPQTTSDEIPLPTESMLETTAITRETEEPVTPPDPDLSSTESATETPSGIPVAAEADTGTATADSPTTDTVSESPPTPTVAEAASTTPAIKAPPADTTPAAPPPDTKPVVAAQADKPSPGPSRSMAAAPTESTPKAFTPTGRVAPSKFKLRVEDKPPPLTPLKPTTTVPIRPIGPTVTQPASSARPPARPRPGSRPIGPAPTRPNAALGGPRPLPSQPSRSPGARQATPAVGYRPSYRPPPRPPGGRKRRPPRPSTPYTPAPPPPITRTISLAEGMTVKDLADKLELRAKDVLKKLIERRMMMTINTTLDTETATMVAREFGADVEMRSFEEEMLQVESTAAQEDDLTSRAPVVTVMGHVDHGKTSLLDAIRKARVAEREAGGITQHIGAYSVELKQRRIVFLDTPGHEAFTLMRARGARVTDIVILVVAADDGVMPQTREAIDHAKAAKVPLIVAINKIDKSNANPERVKTELSELELTPEDWGGQTVTVEVSAKEQTNLDLLLEMILLVTDLGELKANPKRSASGTVLEAKIDRGRGPVATVLVKDGTLRIGDNFIAGPIVGKVRALIDDRGEQQKEIGPSSPVEVLGLTGLPQPGDTFQAVADAAKARQIALLRQGQAKEKTLGEKGGRLTLESLQEQIAEGGAKELPIIVKADVQGSAEVLADALSKLGDERVKVRLISSGAGAVNEGDVVFAAASNAVIVGFNVRPDRNAAAMAEREQIDIRLHRVIYDVTEEIKKAMAGLLDPTVKEIQIGSAAVRDVFKVPKFGAAAGCMVAEGKITRPGETQARLLRDNVVIHEGRIGSLRRFKDDVSEVKNGLECGIAFERYADIKVGDVIEVFTVEKVAATV